MTKRRPDNARQQNPQIRRQDRWQDPGVEPALCTHSNWIDLYPVSPHSLSSFRLTFFSSRGVSAPAKKRPASKLTAQVCQEPQGN
jgi:hypothetical protein